jgi:hypothetical protein
MVDGPQHLAVVAVAAAQPTAAARAVPLRVGLLDRVEVGLASLAPDDLPDPRALAHPHPRSKLNAYVRLDPSAVLC